MDINGICFSLRLKGRDVGVVFLSLPLPCGTERDRNRMMDNNKVMSVCFDAFCFRLVGHLRTSKYERRSYPVSLTCKPPIMLLCCGFVTRCSCNYIGMPNRVADFSLHSSIPRVWFVSVYRY